MNIIKLDWDSTFFCFSVGILNVNSTEELNTLQFQAENYRLIYIFSKSELLKNNLLNKSYHEVKIKFSIMQEDIKTYVNENKSSSKLISANQLSDDLVQLSYVSGKYSRYKLDTNFKNNEFERLYFEWIKKSVEHTLADEVITYNENNKTVGMITYKIKNNILQIGLVAVAPNYQGKGIGRELFSYIYKIAITSNVEKIVVDTQQINNEALKFYSTIGMSVEEQIHIYNLWL